VPHSDRSQNGIRNGWTIILVGVVVASLLLTACGSAKPETYTIGVVIEIPSLGDTLDGFKAGMTQLGYVEGKNITYIYHGATGADPKANDAEIKSLMDQKVSLILVLGTSPAIAAKRAVEGTGTPVIFAPVVDPVGEGLVKSISHPGGNLTGVQGTAIATPKMLEWLLKIAPDTKHVYVPYNPADPIAVSSVTPLPDAAAKLGVELVHGEVSSGEQELAAIKTLPKDSAILFVVSPSLFSSLENALNLAVELRIPTGANLPTDKSLFNYSSDNSQIGKQAAVLADKILKGTPPGDLPVETADLSLSINLKTAQAIGLNVSDDILRQASTVVR
jgi:putative ABC transport system substrate-binding protein